MIRYVIVFNGQAPHAEMLAMAERAKQVLGPITDVRFGMAVAA